MRDTRSVYVNSIHMFVRNSASPARSSWRLEKTKYPSLTLSLSLHYTEKGSALPSSGGCKWSDPVVSDIISQPRPLLIVRTSGAGDRQFWGLIMVFNVKSACLPKLSKSAVVSCIISHPRPQWNMGTRGGHQWESPTQGVIITVGRVSPLSALSGVTLPSMTHDHVNTGDTCPNVSSSLNGKWLGQQSGNTPIWRMLGEWQLKRIPQ